MGYSSNINRNELYNFHLLEIAWTPLEENQIVVLILELNHKTLRYHRLPYFSPNGAILRNILLGGTPHLQQQVNKFACLENLPRRLNATMNLHFRPFGEMRFRKNTN